MNRDWKIIEHSWSDTSIRDAEGNKVCTLSIYNEATEENQAELEGLMGRRARLLRAAPELEDVLRTMCDEYRRLNGLDGAFDECLTNAERVLKGL